MSATEIVRRAVASTATTSHPTTLGRLSCRTAPSDSVFSVEALLLDLLAGRTAPTPGLAASARRLGLRPDCPHCAAVIGAADLAAGPTDDTGRLALAAWRLGVAARTALGDAGWLVRGLGPMLVLVTPLEEEPAKARERLLVSVQAAAQSFRGQDAPVVGVGTARTGLGGVAASFREARYALEVGPALGLASPIDFGHLGFHQLLVPWRAPGDLTRFRDRTIGPLLALRRRQSRTYIDTLATYFASDCQAGAAAMALGIHRNTLIYRLARTRDLIGLDVRRQEERFLIQCALKVHWLLEDGPDPTT